jgi:hypothetical protein
LHSIPMRFRNYIADQMISHILVSEANHTETSPELG